MKVQGEFYHSFELNKLGFNSVGKDVRLSKLAVITHPELMDLGSHVAIDPFVYISADTEIGDYVHIASHVGIAGTKDSYCIIKDFATISQGCKLICGSDDFRGQSLLGPVVPQKYRKVTKGEIVLKRHVALATNVVVFPNVTIEEGTVVGALSVVTKNLPPWRIFYGNPLKLIAKRPKSKVLKLAEELRQT